MARMKNSILIIGAIILVLITIISTYLILLATNVIPSEAIKIEISIVDKQKTYDGTPLEADEYKIVSGKLLDGHNLTLDYIGSITDAGTIKSNAVCHVYDMDHTDLTNKYQFKINQGNLTVIKKNLSLQIDNEEIQYGDGTNLDSKINYSITNGGICSGHKIIPSYQYIEEENNTKLNTKMTAEIFDANGVNVTKNYSIEYKDETLNIAKTKLIYRTVSKTKIYDGEAFGDEDFEATLISGTLPFGYSQEITYDYTGKGNVGQTTLGISKITIYDEHDDDVTERYEIEKQNVGILTINPLEINISVNNYEVLYDGSAHSFEEFSIKSDGNIDVDQADPTKFKYRTYDYKVEAQADAKINAGSYVNLLDYKITDTYGENVTNNFRIEQDPAILTITKRPLIIYGDSITKEYDGTTQSTRSKDTPSKDPEGLVQGHNLKITYSEGSQLKNAGVIDNIIYSYEIKDNDDNIMNNNYDVKTVNGTITVTKKKINITGYAKINGNNDYNNYASDYYSSYGNYSLSNYIGFEFDKDTNFAFADDNLEYNYSGILHAGKYEILPINFNIKEGNITLEDDDLKNYEINITPAKFEIKKLLVIINVSSIQKSINTPISTNDLNYEVYTYGDGDYGEFTDDFMVSLSQRLVDTSKVGTYNILVEIEEDNIGASLDDYTINIIPGYVTVVNP